MIRAPAEVGSAANSYEILAKLAMGGMAEIFLARGASAAGVERHVVLKRVLRHRADDAEFVRMFLDEARLAAQLQHPNIAQVYDIGTLGDSYFFTMEYVHGETVRTLLARCHGLRRTIPLSTVFSIIAGAASGLHHAHERHGIDGKHLGIVHRDVSPSNLMVSYEGAVKVVDFGVAKASHRSTETQSGTVKGKIAYMSPEQCRGGEIDRRSDLFSLGIVMWELLTCERLFKRASDFENMQAIVAEDVPLPSSIRADVPPEVDHIVERLLSKRPDERYQTGDELHEAIEAAAVRTGSALSAASLGRYMRELFGQRPEPWIEIQSHETHPEAFTVTAEPLVDSAVSDVDERLAQVPERRVHHDAGPTLPLPLPSHPSHSQYPMSRRSVPSMPKRSRTLLVVVPAIVLGVVIGIALALGGREEPRSSSGASDANAPAVEPAVVETKPASEPTPAPAPPPVAAPPIEAKPASAPDVTALFKGHAYADVVAACATSPKTVAANAVVCTVSACKAREVSKARRWVASVPAAKRAIVTAQCGSILPTRADDECKRDPMACQH